MSDKIIYNNRARVAFDCSRQHVIYACLIRDCLCLYDSAYASIISDWGFDNRTIYSLGLVSIPTDKHNLIACSVLAQKFGDLGDIPGFYLLRDCWRLDLDEKSCYHGFLLPIRDQRIQISAIRVFRHTKDQFPFILRTRKGRVEAT